MTLLWPSKQLCNYNYIKYNISNAKSTFVVIVKKSTLMYSSDPKFARLEHL